MTRARMSVIPPAPLGTIIRIGREGNASAAAASRWAPNSAAPTNNQLADFSISTIDRYPPINLSARSDVVRIPASGILGERRERRERGQARITIYGIQNS